MAFLFGRTYIDKNTLYRYNQPMKLMLTNNSHLRNLDHALSISDLSNPSTLEITTNDRWINVHPASLTFVAALALVAGKKNSAIDKNASKSGSYLDRMGLYSFLNTPSPFGIKKKESAGRFIPLTIIKTQDEQSKFVTEMTPLLHLGKEQSTAFRYVIGELIRNVIEHSGSRNGAIVAAQFYARKNKISIGICDTGIGLKGSLDRLHHPQDDLAAIRLALRPGISGATLRTDGDEQNHGAGLFVVKSLARVTRDYFFIYSGDSSYKLTKHDIRTFSPRVNNDPFDDPHSVNDGLPNFDGTLIGLDITLDETAEFSALFENIKKAYSHAMRERRQKIYRRPDFI